MDHVIAKEEKSAVINADTKKNIEKIDETFDDLKAKFDKENAKWHDILNDVVANDKDIPWDKEPSFSKMMKEFTNFERVLARATEEEKDAITSYSKTFYDDANNYLRFSEKSYYLDEYGKEKIRALDRYINKNILKRNIVVRRGTGNFPLTDGSGRKFADLKVGEEFTDSGYMSASVNAGFTNKRVQMKINVPKGKGIGAYISKLSFYGKSEEEFLLARGTTLRLKKKYEKDGQYFMEFDLIKKKK